MYAFLRGGLGDELFCVARSAGLDVYRLLRLLLPQAAWARAVSAAAAASATVVPFDPDTAAWAPVRDCGNSRDAGACVRALCVRAGGCGLFPLCRSM